MDWNFPSNNYGQINGIGDAGVETFQGTPLKSLAREICQNSLDAGKGGTVEVEFSSFKIKTNTVNGVEKLKEAYELALKFWDVQQDRKAKDFFMKAIETIEHDDICFLRISDFNTSGLTGSTKEYNTAWTNLIKSSGASDKGGTSGGSFGIGKYAPFACSTLRTVFYNTLDNEGIKAFQGVSRLASFKKEDGEVTQGTGYYGNDKNSPIFEGINIDPNFKREGNETGTDIFIAGFKYAGDDWKADVISSILDGFLVAIWQGLLVVNIEDIEISKSTLSNLMEQYKDYASENAYNYYTVLTSEETKWKSIDYMNYGIIKLGLIIKPDMHRKVAMVRKTGMKIMDKGDISGIIPFAGILLIEGEKINDYLRKLENPQHTKWEPNRAVNPVQAKEVLAGMTRFIKDYLSEIKNEDSNEELDSGVGEYLPDELEIETSSNEAKIEDISNKIRAVDKSVVNKKPPAGRIEKENENTEKENDDGGGSTGGDDYWKNRGTGKRTHGTRNPDSKDEKNGGDDPARTISEISSDKLRVVCLERQNGIYSISFTPNSTAEKGYFELFLSAESGSYPALIKNVEIFGCSSPEIESNKIKNLNFTAGQVIRVRVSINYSDYCSMEVKAYGYKI